MIIKIIKRVIKYILGIYDFDREAERLVKKSLQLYHKGDNFSKIRSIRIYNKLRRNFNCDIYPSIIFGDNNYIAHPNNIMIGKTAEIGNNCKIYPGCKIAAKLINDDYRFENNIRRHAKIMDNVIIGADSLIVGPITIGNNVIIGGGAIVTKDVPDNTIVVGVNIFKNRD